MSSNNETFSRSGGKFFPSVQTAVALSPTSLMTQHTGTQGRCVLCLCTETVRYGLLGCLQGSEAGCIKPKPIAASAEGGAAGGTFQAAVGGSTKSSRLQHTTHSAGKMPPSFTSNNSKEQKMLAYIADFQRMFRELYPYRCSHQAAEDSGLCTVLQAGMGPLPRSCSPERLGPR